MCKLQSIDLPSLVFLLRSASRRENSDSNPGHAASWEKQKSEKWNYSLYGITNPWPALPHSFTLSAGTNLTKVQSTELLPGRASQVLLTDISISPSFDADASLSKIFILSTAMATWAAARRQLGLTTPESDSQAKQSVGTAHFQGGRLPGKLHSWARESRRAAAQPALPKGRNAGFYSM